MATNIVLRHYRNSFRFSIGTLQKVCQKLHGEEITSKSEVSLIFMVLIVVLYVTGSFYIHSDPEIICIYI